ncbi:TrkA family potassium uptake protein [Natronospirillum operosum]|uniref:TrkA family potassium uptake protein n=1 Tax=Natronospirillum operosum TaxID=2759953 RepID=A0A4Z0WF70_9GAMM|nr:TrkA family potassium uptake protein [Natronospirillum operosum]TGG94082.1 TrkA family potassium uptake protein [Natronospirillum operosum]
MGKQRIAVIGLGRFGATLAQEAQANGVEVLAVDSNETKVNDIADSVGEAIIADCTDPKAINAIDWQQFSTVVVAIGSDIKNSMMTVIHLQEAGVRTLWCKVQDKYHAALMSRLGVQKVISPEEEMARRAGRTIHFPDMMQQMLLGADQFVAEIQIINRMDRSAIASKLGRKHHQLLAIKRKTESSFTQTTALPDCLYPGDRILVLSQSSAEASWLSFMS